VGSLQPRHLPGEFDLYDALARDDNRYLTARAIQFFTPGIPQVYYVGALAGDNDVDLLARTGVGRDINRHYYTPEEIDAALQRPVVPALLALCRFRNEFDVFDGTFEFAAKDSHMLSFAWSAGDGASARRAELVVDLKSGASRVEWETNGVIKRTDDLLHRPPVVRQ
jgi:sucrose phosphorylase